MGIVDSLTGYLRSFLPETEEEKKENDNIKGINITDEEGCEVNLMNDIDEEK